MASISELFASYNELSSFSADLDRRIAALPAHDVEAKDLLLSQMDILIEKLESIIFELTQSRAMNMTELHAKAAVLLTMRDRDVRDFALSLADDVLRITDGSTFTGNFVGLP